jgi:hypothetical protein
MKPGGGRVALRDQPESSIDIKDHPLHENPHVRNREKARGIEISKSVSPTLSLGR